MNDDYLWDRTGEPDPDVERLERVLGKYRYQATPLSPALHSGISARRGGWIKFAAVAAAILIALAGFWIFRSQNSVTTPNVLSVTKESEEQKNDEPPAPPKAEEKPSVINATNVAPRQPRRKTHPDASPEKTVESLPLNDSDFVAQRQALINPFIDVETARHIERAQLLLRAFRNTRETAGQPDPEIAYERQRSRRLLSNNVLLRRDAEVRGNLPVEELLGSLEPFLLDIANLPDKPSNIEVRSIKERMQKKEIVSALQVYSAPTLARAF